MIISFRLKRLYYSKEEAKSQAIAGTCPTIKRNENREYFKEDEQKTFGKLFVRNL